VTTAMIGVLILVYLAAGLGMRSYTPQLRSKMLGVTLEISLIMYASWLFVDA
jgi:hypothetical protein